MRGILAAALLLAFCLLARADGASVPLAFPSDPGSGAAASYPVVGYTGPGDLASNWVSWWGLRAFSNATLGNRLVNVCNSTGGSDVGCADMFSGPGGNLASATISGITCPGSNCTIKTWYDQAGSTNITQATVASRANLLTGCSGLSTNTYCSSGSSSASYTSTTNGVTASAPWSGYGTIYPTSAGTVQDSWFQSGSSSEFIAQTSSNTLRFTCGTVNTISITLSNWFGAGMVCNGASGATFSNGTFNSSLNLGSTSMNGSGNTIQIDTGLGGQFEETGIATGAWSSTTAGNLVTNTRNFWGF